MPDSSSDGTTSHEDPAGGSTTSSPATGYFERVLDFEATTATRLLVNVHAPPELRILQKWDSDESGVVWDASILLAKYLELKAAQEPTIWRNKSVIELGSGTGFLGLWMASLGARVLLTDLPDNLELLQRNKKLNSRLLAAEEDTVAIGAFDWRDKTALQAERPFLDWIPIGNVDYFIVSDCLYYKEGIEAIYDLLDWVLGEQQAKAQFFISYEDREDKMEMIAQFLLVIRHNPALKCTEIPPTELHPDYCSADLHVLSIVAQ